MSFYYGQIHQNGVVNLKQNELLTLNRLLWSIFQDSTLREPEIKKEIEKDRANLAGFTPGGNPYFYSLQDFRQSKNSNADFLQDGLVNGLSGSFNGEGIKYTIFDGGRIFAGHMLFNNAANRITNKEAVTLAYSEHATGVAAFIGSKDYNFTGNLNHSSGSVAANFSNLNLRGVAKNSTIDSYLFRNTVLPGNSTSSSVFEKILLAQPKISNHSYGITQGWDIWPINGAYALVWRGDFDAPSTAYDLQGTYFDQDEDFDRIVYTNPSYIIVKAAGNSFGYGPQYPGTSAFVKYYTNNNGVLTQFANTDTLPATNCGLGYDCIGTGSLAKNIIVVGATNVITSNNGRYMSSTDVVHSDYSSAGPRDDGGIKPDITAVGTDVVTASTVENTIGSSTIQYDSGTSYATPIVTGIIGIWTQISKQLFNNTELNAASSKTLMIHSAAEAGNIGPDPHFGWGFIDAKKGAELLLGKSNNTVIFNDEILTSGTVNKKRVKAIGSQALKVTISWIDPAYVIPANPTWNDAYNNRSSKLVNDLDLRIIDTTDNTIYYPWKLNANAPMTPATKADNTVDNVEQVVIDSPVTGREYRVEIMNKGSLVNSVGGVAPQNYSIIVSGYSEEILASGEVNKSSDVLVVPTITKDNIKVLKAPKKSTFTIYDLSGKKLQDGTINSDETTVDLSSYIKGIYIIEVKTNKGVISKKIIKE